MKIKAVILDLDGTLLDTITDITNSLNEALAIHQFPREYQDDDVKYFIGKGIRYTCACALEPFQATDAEIEAVRLEYLRIYETRQYEKTAPFPGMVDLLLSLKEKGIFLGVLSNKFHRDTITLVQKYFPKDLFSVMIGQRPGVPVKPDPNGLIEIMEALHVLPHEVIYVGDTDVDMYTAKNAGTYGAGALWGYRTKEELSNAGADVLPKHPLELLDWIAYEE